MALKACRECTKQVSQEAAVCPHCGIKSPVARKGVGLGILLIVVVVVGIAIAANNPDSTSAADSSAARAQRDRESRVGIAAATLRAMMRDPASFQLIEAIEMPDDSICMKFRSHNGFGGMNVANAIANGSTVTAEGAGGFIAKWNSHCAAQIGADETGYAKTYLGVAPIN